jgi:DNA-binding winged helix-turn-helix (wHTH) protein
VLRALLERLGAPVSKDALMQAAWPGLAVEEGNLTVQYPHEPLVSYRIN